MTYIVKTKNKKEGRALEKILTELSIGFYTEEQEDAALLKAMQKARKTKLLSPAQKAAFLLKLKSPELK